MKLMQTLFDNAAEGLQIETEIRGPRPSQTTQGLSVENRGPTTVAALQMQLRHSHLKNALKRTAIRLSCLMPDLLEHIMSCIPLLRVEESNRLAKARILLRHQRLALAGFLPGSLRRRIDSGVTSSISSGPMYSRARSRVI